MGSLFFLLLLIASNFVLQVFDYRDELSLYKHIFDNWGVILIVLVWLFYNFIIMRLFVHLLNFAPFPQSQCKPIKPIKPYHNNNNPIVFLQVLKVDTTDDLIQEMIDFFNIQYNQCIIRLVIIGNRAEQKVRLVPGYKLKDYYKLVTECDINILNYQIELEIESIQEQPTPISLNNKSDSRVRTVQNWRELSDEMGEVYKYSYQLFQILDHDDILQFKNTINILLKYKPISIVRIILNLYSIENGCTLLHKAIYYHKNQYLSQVLNDYGQYINVNYRSLEGWLPFQLALAMGNKKAIQILLMCSRISLNLNFATKSQKMIYQLINSINLNIIELTIRKAPLQFQEMSKQGQINIYEYLWNHKRFTQAEKREVLEIMHEKHLEFYDYYRLDQILFNSCKKYLPTAPKRQSPKKETIFNPNLKIISGEIIKCRVPPQFSKNIFLSVNCYIGAIEEYEINKKLQLKNDREKLDKYEKTKHISLQEIQSIELMPSQQKSWYMKKDWFCFVLKEKRGNKTVYACIHESAANQWTSEIKQAVTAWNNLQHKQNISKISKNYIHITDTQLKIQTSKKIVDRNYIDLFSKRLSLCEPMESNPKLSISLKVDKEEPFLKSKSQYNSTTSTSMANQEATPLALQFKDFKMLQLLGEGSFGQVFLVQCLRNRKFYALKTFSKKKIILSKQTKFIIAQVNILKQIKHPFIITLHFTMQTPNYIYLGLQFCQGKDLGKHINQQFTFPQRDVCFYAAEIVLALQYIHQLGIIYRDLKPENIMLGKDGHVMLVDFGLSKKAQNNLAKTFCGSPAYLSPEMLQKRGVGRQTDFFSLGVVIFELIFGEPPFYSQNIHILYENIQNGVLSFPRKINQTTKDFLTSLLQKEPKNRLGSGSINEIKSHPYFSNISWDQLMRRQVQAPKRILSDDIESLQSEEELINLFHEDFDYTQQNFKINRFKNFSFVRQQEFI